MKVPVVELSECIQCGVCSESCPTVFKLNGLGYVEVVEMATYPEPEVEEAIRYCPPGCITWQET